MTTAIEPSSSKRARPRRRWGCWLTIPVIVAGLGVLATAGLVGWRYWLRFPQVDYAPAPERIAPGYFSFFPAVTSPDGQQVWVLHRTQQGLESLLLDLEAGAYQGCLEGGVPIAWQRQHRVIAQSWGGNFYDRLHHILERLGLHEYAGYVDPRPLFGLHLVNTPQQRVLSQVSFACWKRPSPAFNFYPDGNGIAVSTPDIIHVGFPRANDDWLIQVVAPLEVSATSLQCWKIGELFATAPGEAGETVYWYGQRGYEVLLEGKRVRQLAGRQRGRFPAGQLVQGPRLLSTMSTWAERGELLVRVWLQRGGEGEEVEAQAWDELWACHAETGAVTPLVRLAANASLLCAPDGALFAALEEQAESVTLRIGRLRDGQTLRQLPAEQLGELPGGMVFAGDGQGLYVIGMQTGRVWLVGWPEGEPQLKFTPKFR